MIVAATGHRPPKLGGYGDAVTLKLQALAGQYLRGMINARTPVTRGISGMALGWDMAWADMLVAFDIPWTAAIPFHGQERQWPSSSQKRYQKLLKKADKVVYVSPGPYASWKMHKRNEWMVNHCERIVALWNGGRDGGTYRCLLYANKQELGIDNLWEKFRDL